jgi:hypothetical protein
MRCRALLLAFLAFLFAFLVLFVLIWSMMR